MSRPFPRLFTALFAALGAAFHLIFAVFPLVTGPPNNLGAAFVVLYLDYPLLLFFRATELCDPLLNTSGSIWLYSILGTAMYAAAGVLVGYGIDRLRSRRRLCTQPRLHWTRR
jgi:hypothetical protein